MWSWLYMMMDLYCGLPWTETDNKNVIDRYSDARLPYPFQTIEKKKLHMKDEHLMIRMPGYGICLIANWFIYCRRNEVHSETPEGFGHVSVRLEIKDQRSSFDSQASRLYENSRGIGYDSEEVQGFVWWSVWMGEQAGYRIQCEYGRIMGGLRYRFRRRQWLTNSLLSDTLLPRHSSSSSGSHNDTLSTVSIADQIQSPLKRLLLRRKRRKFKRDSLWRSRNLNWLWLKMLVIFNLPVWSLMSQVISTHEAPKRVISTVISIYRISIYRNLIIGEDNSNFESTAYESGRERKRSFEGTYYED